jgi:hypothetical protein
MLAVSALLASPGAWAQRSPLPPECRAVLVRACASADNRQACLRREIQKLPDECRRAVSDAQAGRTSALGASFTELAFGRDARRTRGYLAS